MITASLMRLISFLLCLLPHSFALAFGRSIGWIWYHLVRIRRGVVLQQLQRAFPDKELAELRRIRREVYRHVGLNMVEFLLFPRMMKQPERWLEIEGLEHYEKAHAGGRGALILTAHLGNWEFLLATQARDHPLAVITKTISSSGFDRFVVGMRRRFGVKLIPAKQSIITVLKHLRDNGAVGFVIDQNMPPARGVFVRFFDRWAATTDGLALIAAKTGAPVVPAFIIRQPDGKKHQMLVGEAIEYERLENRKQELAHNTARYSAAIEKAIRQHPAQWLWLHRRWKTQPHNPPETTDPYLVLSKKERKQDLRVVD